MFLGVKQKPMTADNLHKRIQSIIASNRVMTLGFSDSSGPWTVPVFYAQDEYKMIFVSDPGSRHSKALKDGIRYSSSIYNPNSEWQKIQGLQTEGTIELPENDIEQKKLMTIYTKKFPFTGIFFSQQDKLPAPLRTKVENVKFYVYSPSRLVLVDNTVSFGFHYELKL